MQRAASMAEARWSKLPGQAGPSESPKPGPPRDIESGLEDFTLQPGLSSLDNALRWGFVRKVYGIVASQLILTAIVAAIVYNNEPVQRVVSTTPFQITSFVVTLLGLIPLYFYQRKHPWNLVLLGVWTACMSTSIGTVCTLYKPLVVLEALVITASIVTALTLYTFYATSKGKDFSAMGPMLFACLMGIFAWGLITLFFPMGELGETIFAGLGALLFSAYIVYDTFNLVARFSLDEYVWAAISLYLDILNLFLRILQLMSRRD